MKFQNILRSGLLKNILKNEITEERTYFALTLLTGIAGGLVAVFLHESISFLTQLLETNKSFTGKTLLYGGIMVFISGYLTTRFFPSTAGSGIPVVRVALAVFHGNITWRTTLAKFFTSVLSLSSGMSLGREGPTVSIAAGIGSFFGSFLHLSKKRIKALVAIGSAAGLSAAFNTPIAAVVFTLEEVVGDLNAKMLGSIVISSVVAAITSSVLIGDHPTFAVPSYELRDPHELITYLIVGLVAALVGPAWVKSVLTLRKFNMKLFKGHRLTIMLATFMVMAGLSLYEVSVLGSGHETINRVLFSEILSWKTLLVLFVLKFFATTISYSSGISGGLFMPTLFMGAMLGGTLGALSWQIFPDLTGSIGAYAIVGMGAFLVSVIRAPFTAIIMIFELTRDYKMVLPLMVANTASYFIASKLHKGSIYESISEQDGIHLPTREDNEILETLLVEDAMITEPISLQANLTTKEAFTHVKDTKFSGFPVLKNGVLYGMISLSDLAKAHTKSLGTATLEDVCSKKLFKIYPDQSLLVAFHKLEKFNISRLPVVSRINDKRLIGIITAEDIVNRFGYHIQEESKDIIFEELDNESLDKEKQN